MKKIISLLKGKQIDNQKKDLSNIYSETIRPFHNKILLIINKRVLNYPYNIDDNLNKKEIYFKEARVIYDEADVDHYIHNIIICDGLDAQGMCYPNFHYDNFMIDIKISAYKVGLENGYELNDEKQSNEFIEILAHELVHAQDIISFINRYGVDEYKKFRNSNNRLAWSYVKI